MSNLFFLVCALAFGLFLGTLPGVRERMPWGEGSSETQSAQIATPAPVTPAAPASSGGAWMRETNRTSLNQATPAGRTMSRPSTNNVPSGNGSTMLSR